MFNIDKKYKILDKLIRQNLINFGEIYYVNGNTGDDDNSGSVASPFQSITEALSKCVADQSDYIIALDSWQETFPITVNKQRTHIIGLDMGVGYPQLQSDTDTAIFNVTKDYCEIVGFALQAPSQTTAHGLIELKTTNIGRANIHHNFFGDKAVAYHGVVMAEGPENWIHDNIFGMFLAGRGITGQSTRGRFNFNNFHFGMAGIGIYISLGVFDEIIGNRFACTTDADGVAITLAAGCQGGGLVDDNHCMETATALTNHPFRDLGTPKANWGLNYESITATMPKTT